MSNLNSIQRLLGAVGAGLALCAVALPATAQEAVQSTESQTVARGADGELRAATAQEQAGLQALKAAKQARVAAKPTLQKFHATNGATGVRLTDDFMSSSTAVRTPDGKIVMECHESHGGTQTAGHVHAATNTPVTE